MQQSGTMGYIKEPIIAMIVNNQQAINKQIRKNLYKGELLLCVTTKGFTHSLVKILPCVRITQQSLVQGTTDW